MLRIIVITFVMHLALQGVFLQIATTVFGETVSEEAHQEWQSLKQRVRDLF